MTKNNKNSILVQGSILAAAGIMSRIIGLAYRIPMTNMLGAEGSALYASAFTIYNMVLTLSSYSFPLAVSKLISQYSARKEYKNTYIILKTILICAFIIGLTAGSLLYFGADFFEVKFHRAGLSKPLQILAPAMVVMSVLGVLRGFFQGKNTMLPTAVSQLLEQIVNAFVSIGAIYIFMNNHSASLLISAYGAAGGVLGTVLGSLAALLLLLFLFVIYSPVFRRQVKRDRHAADITKGTVVKLLVFTVLPIAVSQSIYQIGNLFDNFIYDNINFYKGFAENTADALGVYLNQYNLLINVPVAVASAMASSAIPSMIAAFNKGQNREIKEKSGTLIKFNMVIAFPSAVGLAVLAKPVMTLLFPGLHTYLGLASGLLISGSSAVIFYAYSTITGGILQGINKMKVVLIHSAMSLGVHSLLVTILLLWTNLGIYSLIFGNITLPLMVCVLNYRALSNTMSFKQEVRKSFVFPCLASIIMGIAAGGSYRAVYLLVKSNLIGVVAAILAGVVIYFFFILIFKCFTKEELEELPMGKAFINAGNRFHLL
ncbi:polysaccharide biosynthesis protein [Anaerocolumna sp. AGMB13025]|uniref:putative polysaccharide biosynthesis protein n=1 Tax=Anaerocolumna sp. AGMB13025 TaxID=3039116 RepID=UPI00241FE772|nr:polysaccharide biosynthesis protein [Anaerocolumna sp. AGMB13025]WFR58678.1 polysaccharide biosynthesis protein [Anaerocolumna sp. AGMB13025]